VEAEPGQSLDAEHPTHPGAGPVPLPVAQAFERLGQIFGVRAEGAGDMRGILVVVALGRHRGVVIPPAELGTVDAAGEPGAFVEVAQHIAHVARVLEGRPGSREREVPQALGRAGEQVLPGGGRPAMGAGQLRAGDRAGVQAALGAALRAHDRVPIVGVGHGAKLLAR
jgi:hypothetical protein